MKNKKNMLLLVGSLALSMIAGIAVGCGIEKMKKDCYCVIEEL